MRYYTHLAFAFFLGMILYPFVDLSLIIYLPIVLFATMIPDIDHTESKFGKKVKILGWLLEHRGITHTLLAACALSAIVYFLTSTSYALTFFIGYTAHLLIDQLNYHGVPWFYPITSYRIRGFCKSGGVIDKVVFIVSFVGGFSLVYSATFL